MRKNKMKGKVPNSGRKATFDEPSKQIYFRVPERLENECKQAGQVVINEVIANNKEIK